MSLRFYCSRCLYGNPLIEKGQNRKMENLKLYTINKDKRGSFLGITNKYTWGEINYVETFKNVTRGNHYHKSTKELFYILKGRVHVSIYNIITKDEVEFEAISNMIFIIDPYEVHTFKTLKNSKWINMLSHKLDERNPDIFRYNSR